MESVKGGEEHLYPSHMKCQSLGTSIQEPIDPPSLACLPAPLIIGAHFCRGDVVSTGCGAGLSHSLLRTIIPVDGCAAVDGTATRQLCRNCVVLSVGVKRHSCMEWKAGGTEVTPLRTIRDCDPVRSATGTSENSVLHDRHWRWHWRWSGCGQRSWNWCGRQRRGWRWCRNWRWRRRWPCIW